MKDQRYAVITAERIIAHDARVVDVWENYLKRHDVRLPKEGSASRVWIAILMLVHDDDAEAWIHKDDISALTHLVLPHVGSDQQVRHLKRRGWNLESQPHKGTHRLSDPHRPSSEWENDRLRRIALKRGDFDILKQAFSDRCATCGAKEGEPDIRYGSRDAVVLQQGHRDPASAGTMGNIIPQCQFCNRAYRDDFVFDEKGRVAAVASLRPVKQASSSVQRAIYEFLKKKFSNK